MVEAHARLSPSAAPRWLACPGSVRLSDKVHDTPSESPYAEEGTRAHELAEITAAYRFGLIDEPTYTDRRRRWRLSVQDEEVRGEMEFHVLGYADLLDTLRTLNNGYVRLEQRLDTGVPYCWGTSDAVVVSPGHLDVVDLKYGRGVAVSAEENPQLMLYALGAVRAYGLLAPVDQVTLHIYQPRLNSHTSWAVSVDDLHTWRDEIVMPAAKSAISFDAPFNPGEVACRFCPAAGICRARVEWLTAEDFGPPDVLTPDEISHHLSRVKQVRQWCEALESYALNMAYNQRADIPGYKVVRGRGRRVVQDHTSAIQILIDAGYAPEQVARMSLRSFSDLEKLLSREGMDDLIGDLISRQEGGPTLAPETDKREELTPEIDAMQDFGLSHTT